MGGAVARAGQARFEVRDYFGRAYFKAFGRPPVRHPTDARTADILLVLAGGSVSKVCARIDRLLADQKGTRFTASLATVYGRWDVLGARPKAVL